MKETSWLRILARVGCYCLGLFFLALGVAFSVNSNLGVSPINSLPYVISRIVNVPMGRCVVIVFCSYILLQIVLLGRQFAPINLLQIVFSTIFGYFVDFAKMLVGDWVLPSYAGRFIMLAISIVFIAIGVVLYMGAKLVPMPMEGLTLTIANKIKRPFPTIKTIVDCLVVIVGVVLSVVFLGCLDGIREGTILTALITGKLVALFRKPILPILNGICFGHPTESDPSRNG